MTQLRNGEFVPANELTKVRNQFGDYVYIDASQIDIDELFTCDECGDVWYIPKGSFLTECLKDYLDPDKFICQDCIDEYERCEDCDYLVKDWTEVASGKKVCEECLEENYSYCSECEEYFPTDELHYIESEGIDVCDDCLDRFFVQCEECGEYIRKSEAYYAQDSDEPYCEHCADCYFHYCYECGEAFIGDLEEGDDGEYYCDECISEHRTIHQYGYKPSPLFLSTPDDMEMGKVKGKEFFGFEIEVGGETDEAYNFLEEFGDTSEDIIYLKRDGSVEGFEIVTHPMTRNFINTEFKSHLETGMRYLRDIGFTGHNAGGIHIHLSKEAISNTQYLRMVNLLFCDTDKEKSKYKKWLAITQRHKDKIEQWSSIDVNHLYEDYDYLIKEASEPEKPKLGSRRYLGINTDSSTVEFRIFNSNLRVERIMKNIQVIYALIDFTEISDSKDIDVFLDFIMEHKDVYQELADFLVEKGIAASEEQKEQQRELLERINGFDSINELQEYINEITPQIDDVDNENESEVA